MWTRLPLFVGLLAVTAVLVAISLLSTPTAPDPPPPAVPCAPTSAFCQQQSMNWQAYRMRLSAYRQSLWWPYTEGEIGESIAAAAALAMVAPLIPRPSRLDRSYRLPRFLTDAALLSGLCCAALWASYAVADFYIPLNPAQNLEISRSVILPASHLGLGFGGVAFLIFGAAFVSFAAWRLEDGAVTAVYRTLKMFAVPALLMLSVALLFFDTPEMDLYAVQFLSQVAFMGIPLVSNWFVLIVSASVFLLSLGHAGWKSDRPARM